jgi:hypothetical protein
MNVVLLGAVASKAYEESASGARMAAICPVTRHTLTANIMRSDFGIPASNLVVIKDYFSEKFDLSRIGLV